MTQANDQPQPASATPVEQELGLAAERDAVLRQLDDRTNQTWAAKRERWAALVRAQDAEIERLRETLNRQAAAHHVEVQEQVAAERERWQRVAAAAQAVTTGGEDKLDHFEVPSHLMAALALAMDEGPNAEVTGRL